MAKVKKAQFGTSKSDSLMKESNRKKAFARTQEEIGNSQKKYIGKPIDSLLKSPGWGGINKKLGKDSRYAVSEGKLVTYPGTLSPEERLEIARKAKESAKKDSIESVKSKKMKSGGGQDGTDTLRKSYQKYMDGSSTPSRSKGPKVVKGRGKVLGSLDTLFDTSGENTVDLSFLQSLASVACLSTPLAHTHPSTISCVRSA